MIIAELHRVGHLATASNPDKTAHFMIGEFGQYEIRF